MNILDKTKLDPFSYVVLPTDFEVTDKSQIIFAPNGTGKTTLFNILVKQNTNNCEVYTYDDSCEPTYKLVCSSKRKKLLINPLSKNYSKEEEHKKEEATKLNPKTVISILYPNQTVAKLKKADIDSNILKVIQENVCTLYAPLDNEDRKKLSFILPYFQDIKNVISKRTNLMLLTEEQKKSDSEALKLADRSIIYDYYNVEKHKDDIEHNGCPLCGNRADNVYNEILRIKKEVLSAKFAFFEGFDFLRHLPKGVAPLDAINKTISGINGLSESKMMFLLMTKGDEGIEAQLKASIDNYNNAVASMAKYIAERDDAYNRMFLSKPTIDKYFPLIFPNSKVEFDNEYKTIEINTSRDLITYSEGEKHEMYSIIRELAIIGSYKELVIVDDPLTELDVANEYKNVFRFVRLASEKNKKVIVFTCNPDFINIVNEYHQSLFERYYLMSHRNLADETLTLKLLKMDFANNAKEPYISLKQAIGSDLTQVNNQVISLISERANLEILRNDVNRLGDIGKILHYDCCTNISIRGSTTFSNDQFVTSIDTFTKLPDYSSFSELARDRVYYLAALRVYLEKKIYDYQQERINRRLCNCFVPKSNGKPYLTKEKIEIVDKINDTFKITDKYSKWNKSILMCLKTMLNDNDHPYSQILPISYAISLSDDTLENEIILIKDMFS